MFDIDELEVFKYRIDQYNIYHVYFYDLDNRINRLFLGGNYVQKWFYKEHSIVLIDKLQEDVIKLLNLHKKELPWTLDLESLYIQ
jgi:hypothetical protein